MFGNDNQDDNTQLNSGSAAPADNSPGGISSFNMGKPPLLSKSDSSPIEPTTAPPTDQTATADESSVTDSAPVVASNVSEPSSDAPVASDTSSDDNDLLGIKQQALSQLSPIISHLEQAPEEKFKTLMMMIQASDNHSLIKEAYAAAEQITDETAKAQALLDVVNEINYFTQKQEK